jgi:hypothetical protein
MQQTELRCMLCHIRSNNRVEGGSPSPFSHQRLPFGGRWSVNMSLRNKRNYATSIYFIIIHHRDRTYHLTLSQALLETYSVSSEESPRDKGGPGILFSLRDYCLSQQNWTINVRPFQWSPLILWALRTSYEELSVTQAV